MDEKKRGGGARGVWFKARNKDHNPERDGLSSVR